MGIIIFIYKLRTNAPCAADYTKRTVLVSFTRNFELKNKENPKSTEPSTRSLFCTFHFKSFQIQSDSMSVSVAVGENAITAQFRTCDVIPWLQGGVSLTHCPMTEMQGTRVICASPGLHSVIKPTGPRSFRYKSW